MFQCIILQCTALQKYVILVGRIIWTYPLFCHWTAHFQCHRIEQRIPRKRVSSMALWNFVYYCSRLQTQTNTLFNITNTHEHTLKTQTRSSGTLSSALERLNTGLLGGSLPVSLQAGFLTDDMFSDLELWYLAQAQSAKHSQFLGEQT